MAYLAYAKIKDEVSIMKHSVYFEALKPYLEQMKRVGSMVGVLYYDLATQAPEKAIGPQSEIINFYGSQLAAISQQVAYKTLVKNGLKDPNASPQEKRLFESLSREILLMEKIPLSEYTAAHNAFSKSNEMWRLYRPKNDFASWLPYWEEAVAYSRKLAKARMDHLTKTPYDALLDLYEPGNTSDYLDELFAPLKKAISGLLPQVISRQKARVLPPIKSYPKEKQAALSKALLETIHYDMKGGALAESAHPFSIDISEFDARLTTRYSEEDWRSNLFTILHEGGHCLEFQNKGPEMYEYYLESEATSAICETHSRFYENLIGRSMEFAPVLKGLCAKHLDSAFDYMSDQDFYDLLNEVTPGLIRCDADELTYTLHIIIRYEIERDLINGVIECKDVPAIWNEKYKAYLGVDVPSDKDGCMQDVHWTDGEFGYFPSYALGNLYGAMIRERMSEDLPFNDLIRENKLDVVLAWLSEHDYPNDWMRPVDWIEKVTGKPLGSEAFIRYLMAKFGH